MYFTARFAQDAENTEIIVISIAVERTAIEKLCLSFNGFMEIIMNMNQLSSKIIGAAIEVHKTLGPGLLESAYEECLCHELSIQGLLLEKQKPLSIDYKGINLNCGYRLDIVVEKAVIIELKSCERIEPIHKAQLLTYLKLSGLKLGLILNFNVPLMRDGIVRIVNEFSE